MSSSRILLTRFRGLCGSCQQTIINMASSSSQKIVICHKHPKAHLIVDYRTEHMKCSECGLVVEDRVVDVGSEGRTFSNAEKATSDPSRVGSAQISVSDRALLRAFKEISIMADRMNLPRQIVNRTKQLYQQVHKKKSLKRRSNVQATACLYIACRQEGDPRTFKEISIISDILKKKICVWFKRTLKLLEISLDELTSEKYQMALNSLARARARALRCRRL